MALRDLYANSTFNESEVLFADVREKIGVKTVVIYGVEAPLLLLGLLFCGVFLRVVRRTRCFHQNLRFLLGNFALAFLIVAFARFAIIVPLLLSFALNSDVSDVGLCRAAKAIHDCGLYVGSINIVVIVAERTASTVFVHTYETKKTTLLGLFLVNFQWLFSLLFVWLNQISLVPSSFSYHLTSCQREYTANAVMRIFFLTLLSADFVAIVVFLLLLNINKRRYRHSSSGFGRHYALSARYQIAENVRTTRLLWPLVLAYLIASVLAILILFQAGRTLKASAQGFMSPLEAYLTASNWGQCFDIFFALLAIVFPYLAIYGHHSLRREFKRVLTLERYSVRRPRQPKRLNGDKLIMTTTEEREMHFERLEAMWKHSPRRP